MLSKIKSTLIVIFLIVFATSCNTYREYKDDVFPNYTWAPGQELVFNPRIENVKADFKVQIGIQHIFGSKTEQIPVQIKFINPKGEAQSFAHTIQMVDGRGNSFSECAGDRCDLYSDISDLIQLNEVGDYKISISHQEEKPIPNIIAVGVIVD